MLTRPALKVKKSEQKRAVFLRRPLFFVWRATETTIRAHFNPSTPLLRAATRGICHLPRFRDSFNPRCSYERRRPRCGQWYIRQCFNLRRSCERRPYHAKQEQEALKFQSTPLLRAATGVLRLRLTCQWFQSTPLLRAATHQLPARNLVVGGFNPRRSCERRQSVWDLLQDALPVSIHAALASGDATNWSTIRINGVSIHAALASGDCEDAQ